MYTSGRDCRRHAVSFFVQALYFTLPVILRWINPFSGCNFYTAVHDSLFYIFGYLVVCMCAYAHVCRSLCRCGGVYTCACGGARTCARRNMHTCACGDVHACVCVENRGQLWLLLPRHHPLVHTHPRGLSLASAYQGPASLHFSSIGIPSTQPCPWIFFKHMGSSDQTEALMLARQALQQISALSASFACLALVVSILAA